MRIALIHAVAVAMPPVAEAFERLWPEAGRMNLLDDTLSRDLGRDGALSDAMTDRFIELSRYAVATGADGILFTCSAFGPAIEAAARTVDVPVLKPNEAMFAEAATARAPGLLASFEPSLAPMVDEFRAVSEVALKTACAPDAMAALNAGDGALHDAKLAEAAGRLDGCDVIMLAQFSTARARDAVAAATGRRIMTSPDSAVRAMRAMVQPSGS